MKTYRESFISNNASYGYHGTDYSVNSPIEVYAEIAVKGLNTKREYGTAHAKVEAPSFALKGADHTHRWG